MYKFVKSVSTLSFIFVDTLVAEDTVTGLPPTDAGIITIIKKPLPLAILSYFLTTFQTQNITTYFFPKESIWYEDISNSALDSQLSDVIKYSSGSNIC